MDPINPNHQFIISWSTLLPGKIPAIFCMLLGMPRGSCHSSFVAGIMEGMSILRYIYIVANGYQLVKAHLVGTIVPSHPSNWSFTNTPVTFGEGTHFPLVAMIGEYGASFFVVWLLWISPEYNKDVAVGCQEWIWVRVSPSERRQIVKLSLFFFPESRLAFMFFSHVI